MPIICAICLFIFHWEGGWSNAHILFTTLAIPLFIALSYYTKYTYTWSGIVSIIYYYSLQMFPESQGSFMKLSCLVIFLKDNFCSPYLECTSLHTVNNSKTFLLGLRPSSKAIRVPWNYINIIYKYNKSTKNVPQSCCW